MSRAVVIFCALIQATLASAQTTPRALTPDEIQGLTMSIQSCWNIGTLSPEALAIDIKVRFAMDDEGRPIAESLTLVQSPPSATPRAVQEAFAAARRAVIRCGQYGYDLPLETRVRWDEIVVSFDAIRPEGGFDVSQ